MCPKTQIGELLEKGLNDCDHIFLIYADHLLKQNYTGGTLRKTSIGALTAQTWNVSFLETGFIGYTDFIFARYSATNSGLPCNTQFPKLRSQILTVYDEVCAKSLHRFIIIL
jgi:hypothetical protein